MRLVQGVPEGRERQYVFDRAFDGDADNREVYRHMVHGIVPGVLRGFNATVFAYGATGSGKTYTMVGTEEDPGLMGERCEREGGARGAPWHHARISETLPLSLPPQSSRCGTSSATSATTRTTSGT